MASAAAILQRCNISSLLEKYAWRRAASSHVTAFQPAESRRVNAFLSSWPAA